MKYQIDFNGAASIDVTQLLQSVEKQLSGGNGTRVQGPADTSTAATGTPNPNGSKEAGASEDFLCTHCVIVIVIVAIVAAVIGFVARQLYAIIGHP